MKSDPVQEHLLLGHLRMPMGTSFGYEFHFGYEFFYPPVLGTSFLRILTFPTLKTRPKKWAVFNFSFWVRVFGHQFWKTSRFFEIWGVLGSSLAKFLISHGFGQTVTQNWSQFQKSVMGSSFFIYHFCKLLPKTANNFKIRTSKF